MTIRSPQDCSASEFEIVPDVLGHARAREEQHLKAAEELVAKLRLPPEIGNEFFEAFRHIEINRGRDLAQIPHGFGDPVWRRLATVDIVGAAVEEHDANIVVAAEGVVPGQPVDDNRRFVPEKWKRCQDHGLVGADHAVRVDDALGQSRRSRGEQEFRDGVRPHGGVGRIGFGAGRCCKQFLEQRDPAVRGGLTATAISASVVTTASSALAKAAPSAAKTRPGVVCAKMCLSLPKSVESSE